MMIFKEFMLFHSLSNHFWMSTYKLKNNLLKGITEILDLDRIYSILLLFLLAQLYFIHMVLLFTADYRI